MKLIAVILVLIVGVEHIGIMALEMMGKPKTQAHAFDLDVEFTRQQPVRVLLANQGIYNGMLGISLLASFWLFSGRNQLSVQLLLLAFVVIVALYGGYTATRKIWLLQMFPALVATTVVCLSL